MQKLQKTNQNHRKSLKIGYFGSIHIICTIEGLGIGEPGAPRGWGNLLGGVGGTSAGGQSPFTFKILSKDPSRTSLVREKF